MEKFLFDLDGTLMNADFELENQFLRELFPSKEEADLIIPKKVKIIEEYEALFPRYDVDAFREYFSLRTGVNIKKEVFQEWFRFGSCLNDTIIEGVPEVLEYLKSKDKKLVVLSNWFTEVQIERLRKNGLLHYFEEVYGGDYTLKPNKKAFLRAIGGTSPSECVMVGDNYLKDVLGARAAGCEALFYSPNSDLIRDKQKIKRMNEIKERY